MTQEEYARSPAVWIVFDTDYETERTVVSGVYMTEADAEASTGGRFISRWVEKYELHRPEVRCICDSDHTIAKGCPRTRALGVWSARHGSLRGHLISGSGSS
jgi:hypothetical protein